MAITNHERVGAYDDRADAEARRSWPGLLGLAAIEAELAALLGGRRVDLRTAQDLSPHFRAEVTRSAEVQYAAQAHVGG